MSVLKGIDFMHTVALHLSLDGKNVLIVGGGRVAMRKASSLLETGALLKIVASTVLPELQLLASGSGFTIEMRDYSTADIKNVFMVIAATNDRNVNKRIGDDCKSHGILVCIADNPSEGDCIFPAILRHGDLTVSVSTGGKSPGYAAFIRDRIATTIDCRYGKILDQLAIEREKLLTNWNGKTYNNEILQNRVNELLNTTTLSEEA